MKLESITIPKTVTTIDDAAFAGCSGLTNIIIPETVTYIGEDAFYGCSEDFIIYGIIGSEAQQYANDNNIKFESKYKVSSVKLSATSFTYTGKAIKPSVTIKNIEGKTLKNGTDYTVTYSKGRKNVGKYTVKVTFKGNYSGSKPLYFTVNPKGTTVKSVSGAKKSLTVKWNKQSTKTTGYQIQYSTSSKFSKAKTVTVSSNKTTSKTISKLTGGKKYYVRIRTYKTVGKTKYYSSLSAKKSATAKK